MPASVTIRDVARADLDAVAAVHLAAFPDSAITRLGHAAARRYYLWLLEGPHEAIRRAAVVDGSVAGYLFAGTFHQSTTGFVRRNKAFLAAAVARRPRLLLDRLFRSRLGAGMAILRRRGTWSRRVAPARVPRPRFGVLAIAVDPARQGAGIGKLLMDEAARAAAERGFQEMILSVLLSNEGAIAFYERLGWKVAVTDARSARMTKRVGTPAAGESREQAARDA